MRYTIKIIWSVILLFSVSCNGQISNSNDDLVKKTEKTENQRIEFQKSGPAVIENYKHLPGEVLVKFKEGTSEERIKNIQNKLNLKTIKVGPKTNIYRMKILNRTSVEEVVKSLQSFMEVEYSEPNYIIELDYFK